ncbi:GNAT family N-acetyltransferase [Agromyces sp. NPDC049794]|uniref:GNAT family N-acetyltransferase n=1 Tax=unclassified Agromyces TaxID=2639701 RepID=UPI0033EDBB0F
MSVHEPQVQIRALGPADIEAAASLLGRGMADNPMHLTVYGHDEARSERRHAQLVRVLLRHSPSLRVFGVERSGSLLGVLASAAPGHCRPTVAARARLLGRASTFGPRTAWKLLEWNTGWASHDPAEPHVHLGPVSVDRGLRGQGIGGLLMRPHVDGLDAVGAVGYLETDRPTAVGFYRRFGYSVVAQSDIVGVPCWFMRRPAA